MSLVAVGQWLLSEPNHTVRAQPTVVGGYKSRGIQQKGCDSGSQGSLLSKRSRSQELGESKYIGLISRTVTYTLRNNGLIFLKIVNIYSFEQCLGNYTVSMLPAGIMKSVGFWEQNVPYLFYITLKV